MKAILFFLIGALLLTSCKKDSANTTKTKAELLTASDWIVTSSESKQLSASTWTNTYASAPACQRDNRYSFKGNGTFEVTEGSTKCNSIDPNLVTYGTWSFAANETTLIITTNGGSSNTATINTLSATTLSVFYTTNIGGLTYDVRETYSH